MTTTTIPTLIDRGDIHKSCKSLENVSSILVNYTETLNSLVSINKKLAKALREVAGVKGTNGIPANALNTSACIFEAIYEVDTKFSKIADKEVDALTDEIKKWFKKLAKEEKAHDERLANASGKLKQAGQAYEKKSKRKDADLSEEHSRYLNILNTVGPEMTQDKQNHALYVTQRHTTLMSNVAAAMSRLAETEWGRACEYVRKFAPFVGGVGEARALCEGGWNNDLPADLPDDLSDVPSKAKTLHNEQPKEGQPNVPIQANSTTSTNSDTVPMTATSPRSGVRSRSNTLQVMDNPPKRELSRSPKPTLLSVPQLESAKQPSSEPSTPVNTVPPNDSNPSAAQRSPSPLRNVSGPITEEPEDMELEEPAREPSLGSDFRDSITQSHVSSAPSVNSLNGGSDSGSQRLENLPSAMSKPTLNPIDEAASIPKPSRPLPMPSPKAIDRIDLDRMQSSDFVTSKVATMRDRYDSRATDTSPSQTPIPRDLARSNRVAELANRYTSPPPRGDKFVSSQGGPPASNHFPTFQERYARGPRLRSADKPQAEAYIQESKQEPRNLYEEEVVRYSGVTLQDRDRGYSARVSEERLPMSRAESTYYDELGVRTRGKLPSGTIDELELRAREAQLFEQERRLEVERARLLSARESVVVDSPSQYNRRYSESPRPFDSHQSVHPYDTQVQGMPSPENHSPNCECMRCSQFYASPLTRQAPISSMQEPLSPLRTGLEVGQRRLTTGPMTSYLPPERNLGMSIRNTSSPSIVHMTLPPEDPSRAGRRRSFDIMNNRDLFTNDRSAFPRR